MAVVVVVNYLQRAQRVSTFWNLRNNDLPSVGSGGHMRNASPAITLTAEGASLGCGA